MTLEAFTLDGLSLSNGSPFELADTPEFIPAPMRADWVGGPDVDGAILLEDPHADNCVFTLPLRISQQATADPLVAGYLGQLLDKLGAAAREGSAGIDLVWTPKDWARSFTAVVLLGEIAGLPLDSRGAQVGWLVRSPVITVRLTGKPFLYGAWLDSFSDTFATDTIANYTLDLGSGTISVSGGQLVPSSTAEKNLAHTASTYDLENARATIKVTTGASVASGLAGPILKRLDANNYLAGQLVFAGASSLVRIVKRDGGTVTTLASSSTFTTTTATSYWVRVRQDGNTLVAEAFASAPGATTTRITGSGILWPLAGADITKFGLGVKGRAGIRFQPAGTDWRADDFTVEPNVSTNVGNTTSPVIDFVLSDVPGDTAAEGKLTVIDSAGQPRRHFELAIDPEYVSTAASFIAKASLVTSGFAGIPATLTIAPTAAFGTGTLTHVGGWRVKLLGAQVSGPGVQARLAYRTGDGQYSFTPWVTPPFEDAECEIDFGVIQIGAVALGTQAWDGRVEARSTTPGDTLSMPNAAAGMLLLPVDGGHIKARRKYVHQAGAYVARDEFTAITAGTALNARAATLGGTWATSGATTDFAASDSPAGSETMMRATTSDTTNGRTALLGSTVYAAIEIGVDAQFTGFDDDALLYAQLIARYVDSSNYLLCSWNFRDDGSRPALTIYKVIAGASTIITYEQEMWSPIPAVDTWYTIRLVVFASGVGNAAVLNTATGATQLSAVFSDSVLATGGTLDDGKIGFRDISSGTPSPVVTRYYDNFYAATPAAETLVIESGRTLVLTHDTALKEASSGGTYGLLAPRGARVFVPHAGRDDRQARFVAKARRVDVDTTTDANLTDALTTQLSYRPRYRIPRA